jgi:hypothetical protein
MAPRRVDLVILAALVLAHAAIGAVLAFLVYAGIEIVADLVRDGQEAVGEEGEILVALVFIWAMIPALVSLLLVMPISPGG